MNEKQYEKLTAPLRRMKHGQSLLAWLNRLTTVVIFLSYPIFLLLRLMAKDEALVCYVVIPAAAFILVSLIRRALNVPRPYEKLTIEPLIHKETKGKSFPSRHVFSAMMIALTVLTVYPVWGGCLIAVSVLIALCRVFAGVHFPIDVLAGMGCAIASAVWYWI